MQYLHIKVALCAALGAGALFCMSGDNMPKEKLSTYLSKRDFSKTDEPSNTHKKTVHKLSIFVVQRHNASHLHYDLRLENNGVLTSWAVPKGVPEKINEKHLAVETEDHPLEYADFEGIIPPGNYGAGTVTIWDKGTFENITKDKNGQIMSIDQCLKKGRLKVIFNGKKLQGRYVFIKTKFVETKLAKKSDKPNWLIFKMAPDQQKQKTEKSSDRTITVNRHKISLTHEDKMLFPDAKITKHDLIDYYHKIAPWMLPHMKNRQVTMLRMPDGIGGESFYQKNMPETYPAWISSVALERKKDGLIRMVVANNAATLIYLANQCCITPHVGLGKIDKPDMPDRMIFDFDPSPKNNFSQICDAAIQLKSLLESVVLVPFVMTTGSRGLHVVVPLTRHANFDTTRVFAHAIAERLVIQNPKLLTTEIRKNKRRGRIYVDISRNAYAQTSVAPYAVRTKPIAPVATPLTWDELADKKLTPQSYTIKNIFKRLETRGNPWENMAQSARSLAGAQKELDKLTPTPATP